MEDELKQTFTNHKLAESFPGNLLKIFTYPAPVLKVIAKPVTEFNEELKSLVIDMLHTMYNAPGIGLAAPQVGKSLRFLFLISILKQKTQTLKTMKHLLSIQI